MKYKYKIVVIIAFLLLTLSMGVSFINYTISMNSTQNQLKTQSLPLSVDNIYTEIQKHMIEPFLVSSMMAQDTFVKDWILKEENNTEKIQKYLDSIKNKYGLLSAFLVSHKTKNYYTQDGFLETVHKANPRNQWYFRFKDIAQDNEINLDFNEHLSNTLMMFINFKMFDKSYNYLGATGIAMKISYIDDMLKSFKENYKLTVSFLDKDGNVVLSREHNQKELVNIDSIGELAQHKDIILSKKTKILEYEKGGHKHLLNIKYIQELDIYLLVSAKLDDFTSDTKNTFYLNSGISLFLTLLITLIIIGVIGQYHKNLENLANYDMLTMLPNRRNFKDKFEHFLLLSKRNKQALSLLYMDLDNFKKINDNFGHKTGDEILKSFADILQENVRKTDIYARWGGEEFLLAFVDTPIEEAVHIANKIRKTVENSVRMQELIHRSCTISAGLTQCNDEDTIDSVITRADKAMYNAKAGGKNKVCVL